MDVIIAADVGGTNSRLIAYTVDVSLRHISSKRGHNAPGDLVKSTKYMNQDFSSFEEILRTFIDSLGLQTPPVVGCIAVAGPVSNNMTRLTNRADWPAIDGKHLSEVFGITKVEIINDFVAMGYGLLTLDESGGECVQLQKGIGQVEDGPIACIGAGTGLGECYLTPDFLGDYTCYASEGGHAEFSPRNAEQVKLQNFLKKKFNEAHRVSVERVCSGPGILSVYEYLAQAHPKEVDQEFTAQLAEAQDLKPALIATNKSCSLCMRTMDIFFAHYGCEAGVAACKWIPSGGLYLTGGITSKNLDSITAPQGHFMKSLRDKGRLSGLVESIPIYAVVVEDLGERGAHWEAFRQYQHLQANPVPRDFAAGVLDELMSPSPVSLALMAGAAAFGFAVGRTVYKKL